MTLLPTPHFEKLAATLQNDKLPEADKPAVEKALARYQEWVERLSSVTDYSPGAVDEMVRLLNDYRLFLDVDLIFDSESDFLYRQKGQLKLDNSVIEEFLPHLVSKCLGAQIGERQLGIGPSTCFSSVYVNSSLSTSGHLAGFSVRTKNQDFAIYLPLYIKASHNPDFATSVERETRLAYVAAECKTNLDKTMFQEACATANDVRCAVTGARYFLLCEWLDMTPVSTDPTDIDEVLILRKAKRINSNIRQAYGSANGRRAGRNAYVEYLTRHPFRTEVFLRFLEHIARLLDDEVPVEDDVLDAGYF